MAFSSRSNQVARSSGVVGRTAARFTSRRIARLTARCHGSGFDIISLPTEILVCIFSHCQPTLCPRSIISVEVRESLTNFVRLSHVCRLWRMTMLRASRLWSAPPCWNQKLVSMFLERARDTPLSVVLRQGQDWQLPKADARALLGRIANVTDLHLDFGHDLVTSSWVVSNVLTQSAPRLRALKMEHHVDQLREGAASTALRVLPLGLLQGHSFALASLSLTGYSLAKDWPVPGTLRSLELSSVHLSSASSLVASLASVPCLVALRLSNVRYATIGGSPPMITLSHLNVLGLTIHNDFHNTLFLLEHIRCPGLRRFHMSGQADLDNVGKLVQAARLDDLLRRQPVQPLSSSLGVQTGVVRVMFKGAPTDVDGRSGVELSLIMWLRKNQDPAISTFGLVSLLPELRVRKLEITTPGFSQSMWIQLFELWPDTIQYLAVNRSTSTAGLLSALFQHSSQISQTDERRAGDAQLAEDYAASPLFLQYLQSIEIGDLSLDEATDCGSFGDVLKAGLIARAEAGLVLQKLKFMKCGAVWAAEVIQELQDLGAVINVYVDSTRHSRRARNVRPRRSAIRETSS